MDQMNGKGKERIIDLTGSGDKFGTSSESDSSLDSDSDVSGTDSDAVTPEYLESLLEKARKSAAAVEITQITNYSEGREEDIIVLDGGTNELPLPRLDPGALPPAYFTFGGSRLTRTSSMRDPDVELAELASSSHTIPSPPIPPPALTKSGKPLTKKQKKELKNKTAGPDWFDLPAPPESDLPRLHREVEALRLRSQLDPKRFYRKDEGEGKGIKGLPKHFAIGTVVSSNTPFGMATGGNLARANRKRTLVDELVDDAEAKRYAKKKFEELQVVRGERGKNTLANKRALRRGKW